MRKESRRHAGQKGMPSTFSPPGGYTQMSIAMTSMHPRVIQQDSCT